MSTNQALIALRKLVADGYVKPNEDQKEILRLADQRDDLLEALESLIESVSLADPGVYDLSQALAAIAKARGQS